MIRLLSISPGSKAALAFVMAGLALHAQAPTEPHVAATGVSRDKATLDQTIRDYIMQHPEVLMESLRRGQEATKAAEIPSISRAFAAAGPSPQADFTTDVARYQGIERNAQIGQIPGRRADSGRCARWRRRYAYAEVHQLRLAERHPS